MPLKRKEGNFHYDILLSWLPFAPLIVADSPVVVARRQWQWWWAGEAIQNRDLQHPQQCQARWEKAKIGKGILPGPQQQANGVTAGGSVVLVVVLSDHVTKHQQQKSWF